MYEAFEQVTDGRRWLVGVMTFVLRPAGSAALAVQRLRTTLLGIDQNVPLYDVAQLRDVVAGNAADPRFYALLMTRALRTFLFRVDVTDPATFVAVPCLLGAVALIACYIPARRATATDPLRVLKYE